MTFEEVVWEFELGQGYVKQPPIILSEAEIEEQIYKNGGQQYQNVAYYHQGKEVSTSEIVEILEYEDMNDFFEHVSPLMTASSEEMDSVPGYRR